MLNIRNGCSGGSRENKKVGRATSTMSVPGNDYFLKIQNNCPSPAMSTLTLTPGRLINIDQDIENIRASRQDNPIVQQIIASRESLIDTLDTEEDSDDANLMSKELSLDLDVDPLSLPEVHQHMIRSPPPTHWPRSPNFRAFTSPLEDEMISVEVNTLDHHKLISSASTYETLISQSKPCGDQRETDAKKPKPAIGRHKFHKETENALNKHITAEFNAAFAYLSMACYFGRSDVALPGCQGFFMNMYAEELDHALVIANYVLMRGARVVLSSIGVPENQEWESPENALSAALDMEKKVKEKLSAVYQVAEKHKDLQVMDLISTQFEDEQNRAICELARLVARVKMADDSVGEYLFDRMMYDSFVAKSKDNLMYKRGLEMERLDEVYK